MFLFYQGVNELKDFFHHDIFPFNVLALKKKRNAVLGIDITSVAIKLVELSKNSDGRYTLEGFAYVPFVHSDQHTPRDSHDITLTSQAIKQALTLTKTSRKYAVIAVGDALVITKYVSMPAGFNDEEIMEQLIIDAPSYIPYNVNDIIFDFEVQGPTQHNPALTDILLVVTRKETIAHKTAVLSSAGLIPRAIEVESFAIENALEQLLPQQGIDASKQTIAVIDMGENFITLHIIHHLHAIYTRSQEFGGRQLTHTIAQMYNLTHTHAEQAKIHGGLPENYVDEILTPFKQQIVEQIQRHLQLFSASQHNHRIDRIILSGGCAAIAGIDEYIANALNLPTTIVNPFVNMTCASQIDSAQLQHYAHSMLTAYGLALRHVD